IKPACWCAGWLFGARRRVVGIGPSSLLTTFGGVRLLRLQVADRLYPHQRSASSHAAKTATRPASTHIKDVATCPSALHQEQNDGDAADRHQREQKPRIERKTH